MQGLGCAPELHLTGTSSPGRSPRWRRGSWTKVLPSPVGVRARPARLLTWGQQTATLMGMHPRSRHWLHGGLGLSLPALGSPRMGPGLYEWPILGTGAREHLLGSLTPSVKLSEGSTWSEPQWTPVPHLNGGQRCSGPPGWQKPRYCRARAAVPAPRCPAWDTSAAGVQLQEGCCWPGMNQPPEPQQVRACAAREGWLLASAPC